MIKYLSKKLVKAAIAVALVGVTSIVDAQTFNWSQAGPIYNAGRSRNMIVDKNDPTGNTLYVGSASSGVFMSTDGGINWSALALSNNKLNVSYIAQAIDGTIYVATGEGFLRAGQKLKAQQGTGLYKISGSSLVSVATSSQVGTVINRIACSPSSPNKIALATNFGIIVTTDGSNFTMAIGIPSNSTTLVGLDVKFDSNGILYCSAGNESSATPALAAEVSKVYKSSDNNFSTFNAITTMTSSLLLNDNYGRIELAIAPSNNNVIYASCSSKYGGTGSPASSNLKGLFVSYDAGATWGLILQGSPQLDPLGNGGSLTSGDYAHVITVDPFNSDQIFLGSYQFYYWTRTGGSNSNPIGTWVKKGNSAFTNSQFYLAQNIHDIKLITSGNTISKFFFITDAGIYRSVDVLTGLFGLTSFQPFYKGLITGQFNSVSIERYPLSNVPASNSSSVTPYTGFIGGTGGNGLNYFSGNFPLVTNEAVYGNGDIYQAEFSKILPNAAYFTSGSGKLFRTTDVRSSDPTQVDLLSNSKDQTIVPFNNSLYNLTGTPFKLWENYGQTTANPDSAVFYNDSLRFSTSIQGVSNLISQSTFTFSTVRPNANALIDSIVIRTGTVVLPISVSAANAPAFSSTDRKDISIKLPSNYTVSSTGTTSPGPLTQKGPVISGSTSIVLNSLTLSDNISVTFTAPPFANKTATAIGGVSDPASYYRVFATVFYKYKAGDQVSVVDDNISTKTATYSTILSSPLNWNYGSTLNSFTMTANLSNTNIAVSNPTYVVSSSYGSSAPQTSPTFTVRPIISTTYTLSPILGATYTINANPINYTMAATVNTAITSPTYNLMPGNISQSAPVFTIVPTPTALTNYTITATGSSTLTSQTFSSIGSPTYILNPGNIIQSLPFFVVTPTVATTYSIQSLSSYTPAALNSSRNFTLPVLTFSTLGYGTTAPICKNNPVVKIPKVTSSRIAMGYGNAVYVSNAPLSLNNPISMIRVSSDRALTTDNLGNKLTSASSTVAVSGTVTTLEWSKSGTELYYSTYDQLLGSSRLYRISYLDALLDSTAKNYSGKLHTNIFMFGTTLAPDGSKNNPNSPYRTALLGTYTKIITGINVSNDNKSIAITFADPLGNKVMYSTVADVRKCNSTNVAIVSKNGTGLPSTKVYCSLMEKSDNKKVFIGTDLGVYYTSDITSASPSWVDANNSQLPVIQVFDLKQQVMNPWDCYNSGLIYAATNGRGVWVNKDFSSPYYVSVKESARAEFENNLNLYPNPSNGNVYVNFNGINGETASINVMDINGRVVKHENLGKLNSGEIGYVFETTDLSTGIYIVSINSDLGVKRVAKLVVTK